MRAYTAKEKKEFVKLLNTAKTKLWNGRRSNIPTNKERFICHTIRPHCEVLTSHQYQLLEYIKYMLDGRLTIEEWLFNQGIRFTLNVGEIHSIKIQKYRLD
jgi:hypothetical protein